jgi:fermentation-respiration switch protein FrsA (DUF1100 family)
VLLAVIAVGLLMAFEDSLIFFPSPYPEGDWNPGGLPIEDAWFEAPDATRLHGWFIPHPAPRAVVLFAHGNAGNVTHRIDALHRLWELELSVLIFDYRGYGRSAGRPNEQGILADARAARQWLSGRAGVDGRQIVLLGESIGGAVAVDLASRDGARGLILESAFTSIPDVAAHHYWFLPVRRFMRTRLNSFEKIPHYRGPLLMCHGDVDQIVPIALGQRLFDAANPPKRMVRLVGHHHNDPLPREWYVALDEFIDGLEPARRYRLP